MRAFKGAIGECYMRHAPVRFGVLCIGWVALLCPWVYMLCCCAIGLTCFLALAASGQTCSRTLFVARNIYVECLFPCTYGCGGALLQCVYKFGRASMLAASVAADSSLLSLCRGWAFLSVGACLGRWLVAQGTHGHMSPLCCTSATTISCDVVGQCMAPVHML
eukprot:9677525-Alexandrium_andersonii.AAC.1